MLIIWGMSSCRSTASTGAATVPSKPAATRNPPPAPYISSTPSVTGPASPLPSFTEKIYYIRLDGGTAGQCDGLTDAPYSEMHSPACAWNHPFWALPPGGEPRIAGGDTIVIAAGEYRMGFGAPGSEDCDAAGAYDCYMAPVPGGPDSAHPTRILGAGWDTGCADPPQLWGTHRADRILNLDGTHNVDVGCLEITDHSDCVEFQEGGAPCPRDEPPYGDWASTGIYAEDSSDVHLSDLNIHGLATSGVHAGRLADWTVERVRIAANGWAGWDGDIGEDSSNSGTLTFRHWLVEWNGCGETYPGGEPVRCWAQTAGGYGDGVGTGATAGHWIIEDSAFLHNTSDGLDLLYAREPGAEIEIRRTIAEGNAGNQIKLTGTARLENVIAVGNCGFFEGRPFTYPIDSDEDGIPDSGSVDPCRAGGDTIALDLNPGGRAGMINSTLTGEGGCLIIAACAYERDCAESRPTVVLTNDLFQGNFSLLGGEEACFAWYDDEQGEGWLPGNPFLTDHSLFRGTRFGNVDPCPGEYNLCGLPSGLLDPQVDSFDAHLTAASPAIDAGTSVGAPAMDFDNQPRDARPDIGAYEWRE